MEKMITTSEMRSYFRERISELAKKSSIHEIAKLAGVTEPTVHNAINYPERVKLETLELILKKNETDN